MKLALFQSEDLGGGAPRLGVVDGDEVIDVLAEAPGLPHDTVAWLGRLGTLRELAQGAPRRPLSRVRLLPPVPQPRKFLGIGLNYKSHLPEAARLGIAPPPHQLWFNKQTSCINGPYDPVVKPAVSNQLDYEAELAVVIGRRCRHVAREDALGVVGGYMVANDFSARDWQTRSPTATLGKSFDTHGPIGPWLVTADELGNPHTLRIRTWVNGALRQDGHSGDMIFDIASQIAELSTVMTLEPGDILITGTPAGVGLAMEPPCYLNAGDVVRVEIERIGAIENRVVEER